MDGAARLCVHRLDWMGRSWAPSEPGAMDDIISAARDRMRQNPGWHERLEAFLGGDIDLADDREATAQRGQKPEPHAQARFETMALQYAALGWAVLPVYGVVDGRCTCAERNCRSIGKHPRTKNGLKDASTSPTVIAKWYRNWPDANVGIITGAQSGLVVLDIDPQHGGDDSLVELCRRHGELPATLSAHSGGGGRHLFFRHPGGKVSNSTNFDGLPGLDVRGDGGYIVAAPSTHASGGSYAWAGEIAQEAASPAPEWFYSLANAKRPRTLGETPPSNLARPGEAIPEGGRNRALFEVGCKLRARGNEHDLILAELQRINASRCQPPLDQTEVKQIANSAASYDSRLPNGDQPLIPIPDDAPAPDTDHPQLGAAVTVHTYRDSSDRALWHVCSFWNQGKLETRPLTLWGDEDDTRRWLWKGPGKPRPLFRLPQMLANPDAPVLVVRDEPSADRVAEDLFSWAVTCPLFGTMGIRATQWEPLHGRRVLVWGEDTEEGRAFAKEAAARIRGAHAAKVVTFSHDYLPSADGGVIRGRSDGGATPSAAAGWTEAHLNHLLDVALTPDRALINEMNNVRDNKKNLPTHRRDQVIAEHLTASLRTRGKFYHERDAAFFFLPAERRLISIDDDNQAFVRLLSEYGINRAEKTFGYLAQHLWIEATNRGAPTEVRHLAHYDQSRNTAYVFNQGGLIYKATPAGIETVENGADGILFLQEPEAEPFHIVDDFDPQQVDEHGHDPVQRMLAGGLSLAPGVLTPAQGLTLLRYWIWALFMSGLMTTRPVLALVGEKGSAKTAAAKRIGLMLFGRHFDVTSMTDDVKDFDAAAAATSLLVLDNADTDRKWLADKLAILATGGRVKKRVLYTTNQMVSIKSISRAIITSRTPHFKRDDVAERLLLLRTMRLRSFVAQAELDRRTVAQRDVLMTNLLHDLVTITAALRAHGMEEITGDIRMADFYAFSVRVARYRGEESDVTEAFRRLQRAQVGFATEGDPIAGLIEMWLQVPGNAGKPIGATQLYAELCEIAQRHRRAMPEGMVARSFSQYLSNSLIALRESFEIGARPRKNTAEYTFHHLPDRPEEI